MFTGIIEQIGSIRSIARSGDSAELSVAAPALLDDLHLGDSVAVNGACLTVTDVDATGFRTTAVEETLARTNLGRLSSSSKVNLERAMQPTGRFGGHLVNGHVDGLGVVARLERRAHSTLPFVECDRSLCRYLVEKGWITVDGVSLTVVDATDHGFTVSLIPHTRQVTTLGDLVVGDRVNLEVDILAKYVERLLGHQEAGSASTSRLTPEFLREHGIE
ncbi:MAG: riboflavin synthase [Armatimonadetes bacterium CG_4_10_14_0_8_um_filter_66_14]|nr:riboflavin synthase [Armatimonadota bacterium]PIU91912.1 MAG: riboflavin synthase [Armatimonadetes bacterium CG06_land_8_20_14_3_00_66_21]PIZ29631.1 MAG: riboflavin synthase [Armatimonadetes bacterium CG_4_10_14_0_8_um_filter_66_14]PJB72336.1 MAG: riboflavin synthase [Armatimonadetes bacterium CG_4_9_14_3_um_filter_66_14]NCO89808.1 riboflavin synthase [Armatimonadota bacterium]